MNHNDANNYNFDWSILCVCLCARGNCQNITNKTEFGILRIENGICAPIYPNIILSQNLRSRFYVLHSHRCGIKGSITLLLLNYSLFTVWIQFITPNPFFLFNKRYNPSRWWRCQFHDEQSKEYIEIKSLKNCVQFIVIFFSFVFCVVFIPR